MQCTRIYSITWINRCSFFRNFQTGQSASVIYILVLSCVASHCPRNVAGPRYLTMPRHPPVSRYAGVPRYFTVPRYVAVPRYIPVQWHDAVLRYMSVPRQDAAPRYLTVPLEDAVQRYTAIQPLTTQPILTRQRPRYNNIIQTNPIYSYLYEMKRMKIGWNEEDLQCDHKVDSTNISIVFWVAYSDTLCLKIKSWMMNDIMTTNENEMEGEWACP